MAESNADASESIKEVHTELRRPRAPEITIDVSEIVENPALSTTSLPSAITDELEKSKSYVKHNKSHNFLEVPGRRSIDSDCSAGTGNTTGTYMSYEDRTPILSSRMRTRTHIMRRLDQDELLAATGTCGNRSRDEAKIDLEECIKNTTERCIFNHAVEIQSSRQFDFQRFERLCIVNILNAQHELILLDEELSFPHENTEDDKEHQAQRTMRLRDALERYRVAIETFHFFSDFKQPGLKSSRLAGRSFAVKLREPRYWDSPDALNLIELTPPKPLQPVDRLRCFLQNAMPVSWLDQPGKEQREVDVISRSEAIGKGTEAIRNYYQMHARHTSPIVDRMARLIMSTLGGVLLLVPMTALALISSLNWALIATCLFVLFFGVVLSLVSKVSNDQILVAAAAYGAVLVVFVANTLPLTLKT